MSEISFLPILDAHTNSEPYLNLNLNIEQEPLHLIWHVTNKCNLDCDYCFTNSSPRIPKHDSEALEHAVKVINNSNVTHISVIGGEPLLIQNLPKILNAIRSEITINLDTNLTLLNSEKLNKLKERITQWNTTLDSHDEDIHNNQRGRWKLTMENIKLLIKNKQKVAVNVVITKYNWKSLEETVQFLLNLNIHRITLSKACALGKGQWSKNLLTGKNLELAGKKVEKICKENQKVTPAGWYNKNVTEKGEQNCSCAINRLTIDWNGNIYACEMMAGNPGPNIRQVKDLKEGMNTFKDWAYSVLLVPSTCRSCERKNTCNKGCKFTTKISAGTVLAKPTHCDYKPNSVYEVMGYETYTPLQPAGKKRWKTKTAKNLKQVKNQIKLPILDLGSGAGVWSFYLEEKLKLPTTGIDLNPTMIDLFNIYKEKNKLKSKIKLQDALKIKEKYSTILLLDNFLNHLTKDQIKTIITNTQPEVIIIEFYERNAKNAEYTYNMSGRTIKEKITKLNLNQIHKEINNGIATAEVNLYTYKKQDILKILKNYKITDLSQKDYCFILAEKTNTSQTPTLNNNA